jgi:hypothetical protein
VDWKNLPPCTLFTAEGYPPDGPFLVVALRQTETCLCSCGKKISDPKHEMSFRCKGVLTYLGGHHAEVQIAQHGRVVPNRFRDYETDWWPVRCFQAVDSAAA